MGLEDFSVMAKCKTTALVEYALVQRQFTTNKGTPLKIRFGKPLYKHAPSVLSGTVMWCKNLSRDDFEFSYGVGIKYD